MKNLYLILTLTITSLWLYSCDPNKQDSCQDSYKTVNLTDFQKTRCPYSGYDTLVFVSNQNDTVYCYGRGKSTTYDSRLETSSPDCGNYTNNEITNYVYDCNNSILTNKIAIKLSASDAFELRIFLGNYQMGKPAEIINDKYYNSIIQSNNITYKTRAMIFNGIDTLFYNHHDGIVRILFSNQLRWDILKKF